MGCAARVLEEAPEAALGADRAVGDEDIDELEEIEDEVAIMAGHIHAGMRHFLGLIARFDQKRGWIRGGHRTCAHWLSFVTGFDLGTAREYLRVARALEDLPETGAAMGRGALSFSQVRALTRVARPETEADLLDVAEGATVSQLERLVRAWRTTDRLDEEERARVRHESRTFSVHPNDDGMYEGRFLLEPEAGALLMRAVEAASDALFRERNPIPVPPEESQRQAAQRRADALTLLAGRAMAAGFGSEDPKTLSGTRAERYQVMLHLDAQALSAPERDDEGAADAEGVVEGAVDNDAPAVAAGRGHTVAAAAAASGAAVASEVGEDPLSELEDGTRVSYETHRRLCCDASVVRVERGARGEVLDIGRRTRTISSSLRRALEVRDGGCRFPGCGMRFTDGHHVVHWADGGETSLGNTILLCGHHHRLMHEGGWRVEWWGADRQPAFRDPRGNVHMDSSRKLPRLEPDPVARLVRRNRLRGADPDARTAAARWEFERDIPDGVLFRAMEAAL